MQIRHIFVAFAVLFLAGCATEAPAAKHAAPFPRRLALLPLSNGSLNVDAPAAMRNLLDSDLAATTISLVPVREVDDKLKGLGITEGGQIRALLPQKLGSALEA